LEITQNTGFTQNTQTLGIRLKFIRPYTPRHNGKVERSHREDVRRSYADHRFFSLADFQAQVTAYNRRSNAIPMRPLRYLYPALALACAVQFV